MKTRLHALQEFGNLTTQVSAIRFLLGWVLLAAGLSWLFPFWSRFGAINEFIPGAMFLFAALIARFSPRWFGAWPGLFLFAFSIGLLLSIHRPHRADLILFLFAVTAALAMALRFLSFVITTLRLWSVVPLLFWSVLFFVWLDFYERDLHTARFKVILWLVPIISVGFVILRLIAERLGELWAWLVVAVSSISLASLDVFYNFRHAYTFTLDHPIFLQFISAVFVIILVLALFSSIAPRQNESTKDPFWLLKTLHCGALFSLVPLFVLLSWRSTWFSCFGMSHTYTNTTALTGLFALAIGPMILEKSNWCGDATA